jgi:hypothetical protein
MMVSVGPIFFLLPGPVFYFLANSSRIQYSPVYDLSVLSSCMISVTLDVFFLD